MLSPAHIFNCLSSFANPLTGARLINAPVYNQLTFAASDPYSRQPSYKACAVRIEPTPTANP